MPRTHVKKVRKGVIRSKIGKDLPTTLSETLVKNWYTAIGEFACNAYDEDAENVHINTPLKSGVITIKDDGSGMDEKGLEHFFRLGDSVKILEPISKIKKRKKIGKHGIAKILLQYLGRSFKIESVKDGSLYVVDEGVVEGDIPGQGHDVPKSTPNGTTITIRDLKFKIGNGPGQFDTERLYKRLQWDTPNRPDFNVFVNDKLVKKRGGIAYARVYRVHERIGRHVLRGRIYWKKKGARDLEGIRIYVNGRSVGGSSMIDLARLGSGLSGRTQGEIHADFLEDIITLDREGFQEDPRLEKVKKTILKILNTIKSDISEGRGRRAFYQDQRIYNQVQKSLELAEEQFNRVLKKDSADKGYYLFELSGQDKSGPVSSLSSESKTVYFNAGNKMFTFLTKTNELVDRKLSEIYLKRVFLIAAAHALVNKDNKKILDELIEEQTSAIFSKFPGIASAANRFIEGRVLTPLRDIYLNKYRLYDHQELSSLTGRSPIVIRLLHNSGALPGSEEHLFGKKDILNIFRPLEKYISCIEVADQRYEGSGIDFKREMIEVRYTNPKPTILDVTLSQAKIKKQISKFGVINVGKKHPLHFVPLDQAANFKKYAKENNLYNGS